MEGTGNASWFLAGRAQEEPPGARGMQDSTMGLPDRGTVKGGRGFVSDRFCGACKDRNEMPGPLQASWGALCWIVVRAVRSRSPVQSTLMRSGRPQRG